MSVPQIITVSHSYSPEKIKLFYSTNTKDVAQDYKRLAARLHRKSVSDLGAKPQLKQRFQKHVHLWGVGWVECICPFNLCLSQVIS